MKRVVSKLEVLRPPKSKRPRHIPRATNDPQFRIQNSEFIIPNSYRVGIGSDLHRLAPGRQLILGGVKIPFDKGPVGHSDADALIHAICDALLGAAALGDIGRHFPDTSPEWHNAASLVFLRQVGLDSLALNWLGDTKTALPTVMMVMIWVQIGYPVVIFMAALQRVDPELYEAAELDGAGWYRRFRAITLPQIKPESFVVTLTCTIAALKVFGPIYVLTKGGPENTTNVPSYFSYQNFFPKSQVGYGSAIATVLTIIVILVSLVFIRAQAASERKEGR